MTIVYDRYGVTVHHGDCLDVLAGLPDNSVHSVCTDPPYGIRFMGKAWDGEDIEAGVSLRRSQAPMPDDGKAGQNGGYRSAAAEAGRYDLSANAAFGEWCRQWASECLRVLKPGGHLVSFGGSRTWHRLAAAVEDAGFEIRDSIGYSSAVIAWCYGTGFPKSHNINRDDRVCQCLPDVRDPATEQAAESAAQVLLEDLCGAGKADVANIKDLHGVPIALHPDFALPSCSQPDLLAGMRGEAAIAEDARPEGAQRPASEDPVRDVRGTGVAIAESGCSDGDDLLRAPVCGQGQDGDVAGALLRRDREAGQEALRLGQPSLERRGDVQAPEGQLHRAEVRAVPGRTDGDGPLGRVRDGAPASDGAMGRANPAAQRVCEPHQPQPAGQPTGEPRAVPDERGSQAWRGWPVCGRCGKPALPSGLGTALKPAWEPIVVARKPLAGTVAGNVLEYGTGALNIDGCRVGAASTRRRNAAEMGYHGGNLATSYETGSDAGRWPSNVVLTHAATPDGADLCSDACVPGCPVRELDEQSGNRPSGANPVREKAAKFQGVYRDSEARTMPRTPARGAESGGASRFFPVFRFEAKAPAAERPRVDGVAHPTVKPLALMRWLVRLVTPPAGVVLDPFLGSGTTAQAARAEGFQCVGIEREESYLPLIRSRLDGDGADLFSGGAA